MASPSWITWMRRARWRVVLPVGLAWLLAGLLGAPRSVHDALGFALAVLALACWAVTAADTLWRSLRAFRSGYAGAANEPRR